MNKIVITIPARYGSSRFEGKPLADINGKPMIWWVYNNAKDITGVDSVIVAIDDKRVEKVCRDENIKYIMTSRDCETGTDRIVELSKKVDADWYLVLMGDEPLLTEGDLKPLIKTINDGCYDACMLMTKFHNSVDVVNSTTIKLALNADDEIIFMSRQPIPYPKAALDYYYYKNVGAYAFSKKALEIFRNSPRGRLERIEDLEMLRLIEKHCIVKGVEIETNAMSVDTEKDLERIRRIITERGKMHQ